MKNYKFIWVLIIILIFQSCASTSSSTKSTDDAETAFQSGNYKLALTTWEKTILSRESKSKKAKAPIYVGAGRCALELEQIDKSRKYLETARSLEFSSPKLYSSLAKVYKNIDNLSKEITALEIYHEKYPDGKEIDDIKSRLFENCCCRYVS